MRFCLVAVVGAVANLGGLASGGPGPPPRPPASAPAEQASRAPVPLARADSDLDAIRDIFRFGDAPQPDRPSEAGAPDRPEATPAAPTPPPGARLVGLVRRPGGLRAALALEGEVVLLGAGDSALGYTVLDVSEERVIVRDPGGEEIALGVGPG